MIRGKIFQHFKENNLFLAQNEARLQVANLECTKLNVQLHVGTMVSKTMIESDTY